MFDHSFFCPHCCYDAVFQFQAAYELNPKTPPESKEALSFASFWKCGHCFEPISVVSLQPFDEAAIIELARDGKYSFKFLPENVLRIYPEARRVDPPEHTPAAAAKFYRQGRINFSQGHFEPCVMLMKKSLELAIKELHSKAEGVPARKLEQAFKAGLITEPMYRWAETIKLFGNEADNDPIDIPREMAEDVMAFTEVFLLYAFTLPAMVKPRPKA